ncbi:DUF3784 domain-containing protein [Anaerovorax odorimutans]|uniref:DUF3784 domain-containing protein n=1 Tax=Anaerovorax odorimutans TaxID=109327 RepID=UPI0003F7EB54|nr:DUF3784 domain-containing protein [Anaerovorax odorimutans]
MNIGMISCVVMAVIFGMLSLVFTFLKDEGAILISGFNTMPKEEREKYDKEKMSADQRNELLNWTVVFIIGSFACYFINTYFAIVAFIVWLILFFKNVHFNTNKAFEKYRKG